MTEQSYACGVIKSGRFAVSGQVLKKDRRGERFSKGRIIRPDHDVNDVMIISHAFK
jgi:hypothetical protein